MQSGGVPPCLRCKLKTTLQPCPLQFSCTSAWTFACVDLTYEVLVRRMQFSKEQLSMMTTTMPPRKQARIIACLPGGIEVVILK